MAGAWAGVLGLERVGDLCSDRWVGVLGLERVGDLCSDRWVDLNIWVEIEQCKNLTDLYKRIMRMV